MRKVWKHWLLAWKIDVNNLPVVLLYRHIPINQPRQICHKVKEISTGMKHYSSAKLKVSNGVTFESLNKKIIYKHTICISRRWNAHLSALWYDVLSNKYVHNKCNQFEINTKSFLNIAIMNITFKSRKRRITSQCGDIKWPEVCVSNIRKSEACGRRPFKVKSLSSIHSFNIGSFHQIFKLSISINLKWLL